MKLPNLEFLQLKQFELFVLNLAEKVRRNANFIAEGKAREGLTLFILTFPKLESEGENLKSEDKKGVLVEILNRLWEKALAIYDEYGKNIKDEDLIKVKNSLKKELGEDKARILEEFPEFNFIFFIEFYNPYEISNKVVVLYLLNEDEGLEEEINKALEKTLRDFPMWFMGWDWNWAEKLN